MHLHLNCFSTPFNPLIPDLIKTKTVSGQPLLYVLWIQEGVCMHICDVPKLYLVNYLVTCQNCHVTTYFNDVAKGWLLFARY